jgi:hypothetical protein
MLMLPTTAAVTIVVAEERKGKKKAVGQERCAEGTRGFGTCMNMGLT